MTLDGADTMDLSGRFYHEARVASEEGKVSTVTTGVMHIQPTLIRD